MDTVLNEHKEDLAKRGLPLQPTIVITGPLFKIEKCYVCVNEVEYEMDSCIEAVDFALQIFVTTDCDYPHASAALWTFIQIASYEITITTDKTNLSLKLLPSKVVVLNVSFFIFI